MIASGSIDPKGVVGQKKPDEWRKRPAPSATRAWATRIVAWASPHAVVRSYPAAIAWALAATTVAVWSGIWSAAGVAPAGAEVGGGELGDCGPPGVWTMSVWT